MRSWSGRQAPTRRGAHRAGSAGRKPVHEIGKYGGTLRRGLAGRPTGRTVNRLAAHDHILYLDHTANVLTPNVAKAWKVSDDGLTTTITLRKGMKWSDGQPFTADDFVFWYQDMVLNDRAEPESAGSAAG